MGDKCKLMRPKEPRVGDKCGKQVWETSVNSCGPRNPDWETSVGNKCGIQVEDKQPKAPKCEGQVGDKCNHMRPKAPRVGDKCGKQVWWTGGTQV